MRSYLILAVFLLAAIVPVLLAWIRTRRWGLPVRVYVDREDPKPSDLARYLAEIAQRLDARPERMRIVFDGRNRDNKRILLDLKTDRTLSVSVDGHRPQTVDLRARWIADHPVPLDLRHAVLYVEPVDANRFRVLPALRFSFPISVFALCSLAATAGLVFLIPELVAAAVGLPVGAALSAKLKF